MSTFKGMCVPICTPFVEGGEAVDEGAFKAHIDWMLEWMLEQVARGAGDCPVGSPHGPARLRRAGW